MGDSNDFLEDVQHLQDLDPSFVSQVDLVVCAQDDSRVIGFPVHSHVISSHSPILSQVLRDLNETGTKQRPIRLPMVDDDCSAVRETLVCVYGRLPRAHSQQAVSPPTVLLHNLETVQVYAKKRRLAYKYGMLDILQDQEKALVPTLDTLVTQGFLFMYNQQQAMVLETAIVADDCKCAQVLSVCEALIAKHFDDYSTQEGPTLSRMSSASLLRVAQGVSLVGAATMSTLHKALGGLEAEAVKGCTLRGRMICPRCNKRLDLSKKRNVVHLNRSSRCRWPSAPRGPGSHLWSWESQNSHSHF